MSIASSACGFAFFIQMQEKILYSIQILAQIETATEKVARKIDL